MNYEKYLSLIRGLEDYSKQNRSQYEFRVFLFIALGYAYFVGLIILLIAPIFLVALGLYAAPYEMGKLFLQLGKLLWIIVPGLAVYFGFIGSAVKAITARPESPTGPVLNRKDAPELFEFIDSTCKELKAKRPKTVLITDEFNAAVATLPRVGIFGTRVFLLLGLPLMKALSPDQFKGVLAHEIGHISGKHGSFAKWAYQMREAWGRLIESQELTDHKFAALYKNFVDWFFPYFSAYSFVLMREHERDADRDAAKIVGSQPLGEALLLLQTKSAAISENFWSEVHKENLTAEVPSKRLFSRMLSSISFVDQEKDRTTISKALAVPTDYSDSHPSLAERLRLIGYIDGEKVPEPPSPGSQSAADEFLGINLAEFSIGFDASWDEQAANDWERRHRHFKESDKRVEELLERDAIERLTVDEILEIAARFAEKEGIEKALPYVERAVREFPDNANAIYNLGGVRLALEDERGIADLERAANLDHTLKLPVSEMIFGYLRAKGRFEEAKVYAASAEGEQEIIEKAHSERQTLSPEDQFEIHTLPLDALEKIPPKLTSLDEITAIYAVRKVVKYFPEIPFHVIFIALRKKSRFKNKNDLGPNEIVNMVAERLNFIEIGYFQVLVNEFADHERILAKIDGAKVFEQSVG